MTDHFISGDWGTSRLRLRSVRTDDLEIVSEAQGEGIKELNKRYEATEGTNREAYFADYLKGKLASLPATPGNPPLVMSGMASSSIGLRELPYVDLPFPSPTAKGALARRLDSLGERPFYLVTGLRSETDVMRGEETQALGLLATDCQWGEGTVILPGTHSKHIRYREGSVVDFRTFMTGELFSLLAKESTLREAVLPGAFTRQRRDTFLRGVDAGLGGELTAELFGIRAAHLHKGTDPVDAYYRLSGLLIGDELRWPPVSGHSIHLLSAEPLRTVYMHALTRTVGADRCVFHAADGADRALLAGQRQILYDA